MCLVKILMTKIFSLILLITKLLNRYTITTVSLIMSGEIEDNENVKLVISQVSEKDAEFGHDSEIVFEPHSIINRINSKWNNNYWLYKPLNNFILHTCDNTIKNLMK